MKINLINVVLIFHIKLYRCLFSNENECHLQHPLFERPLPDEVLFYIGGYAYGYELLVSGGDKFCSLKLTILLAVTLL